MMIGSFKFRSRRSTSVCVQRYVSSRIFMHNWEKYTMGNLSYLKKDDRGMRSLFRFTIFVKFIYVLSSLHEEMENAVSSSMMVPFLNLFLSFLD
uniref:Uncharacterized protein n=1 Tax=Parascaris equorum TaxID=6256 RepID=A0A914S6W7_PAREQ